MLLVVGHIGKPHGIRGEVLVTVRTDEPEERYFAGQVFVTEVPRDRRVNAGPARSVPPGDANPAAAASGAAAPGVAEYRVPGELVLESLRWHQGRVIAQFEGVHDRNVAEALRGVLLQVDSSTLKPPADPDEFHDHQLVGLRVVAVDGTEIGVVSGIDHAPASDLIVVDKATGGTGLIPFVSRIVPTVDLAGGRVVVDLPEGLLDL